MRTAHKATAGVLVAAAVMTAGYEGSGPRVSHQPVPTVRAYKDSVNVTTICFGETWAERPGLKMGDTDTLSNCTAHLPAALKKYDAGLTACLNRDIPDGMHVVLISTTYNIGVAAFCRSSMARLINIGDLAGACHALRLWNKAGGQPQLDRRRRLEERDCLRGLTRPIPYNGTIPDIFPSPQEPPKWNSPSTSSPSSASLPSSLPPSTRAASSSERPPLPAKSEGLLSRLWHWLNSR